MLWMTELNKIGGKPRYRLLKAEVGASSYMFDYPPTVTRAIPTTTAISQTTKLTPVTVAERSNLSFPTTTQSSTPVEEHRLLNIILIFSNVFSVVLLSIVIIWLVLKLKRKNSLSQNTNEAQQMSVLPDEPAAYDDVGPEEVQYEEVKNDQAAARPPSPGLYEPPIRLSPRSARRVKAMPERPRTFEKFGEAPRAPLQFEYDYVRTAQPEPLYDEVKPEPSATTPFEDTTSESTQYLQLLN
ncbi:uncharacterized protein LOC135937983 [Cloeon dipterum]|uniref:uncharacterized protein LOC135937983 n=1 Tax=Cloeon dipterum TaxID=197152 RepID=UPI00321FED3D